MRQRPLPLVRAVPLRTIAGTEQDSGEAAVCLAVLHPGHHAAGRVRLLCGGTVPQSPAGSRQGNGRRPAGADHHPRRVPDV